jgi:hypothetical protein
LTLSYQNHSPTPVASCIQEASYGDSYDDMMDRCYWDYVRVYVPAGSRLLAGPDTRLPPGSLAARRGNGLPRQELLPVLIENGWMVWTAFFALEPGREQTLTFDYELPAAVLSREGHGSVRYHLRVQKQPGTEAVPLQLTLTLPPDAQLVHTEPIAIGQEPGPSLRITADLRLDSEFEVVYQGGSSEP